MSDNEIASMFTTETVKLFTDIIYMDNCHHLMVKTWQKVIFSCKLPGTSKMGGIIKPNTKGKGKNAKGSIDSISDSKG